MERPHYTPDAGTAVNTGAAVDKPQPRALYYAVDRP